MSSNNENVCDKPYTSTDKWTAAVLSGLSFLVVSSPYTYSLTNDALQRVLELTGSKSNKVSLIDSAPGGQECPSPTGLAVHSMVYTLLIRLMMEKRNLSGCKKPYSSKDKWIASVIGGLMFLTLSSPYAYKLSNSVTSKLGVPTMEKDGCVTAGGLLVHTGVFTLLSRLLMR